MSPNPVKVEHLVKEAADLEALAFATPAANIEAYFRACREYGRY